MPNAVTHPSAQELAAFGLGKLSESASTTIANHLEKCPACRKAIENAPADSFVGKVRAAKPGMSALPNWLAGASDATNLPTTAAAPFIPPEDLPPDLANYAKYRFLRELGRGGMGVVYQAEQTVMGRLVAVKVINPSVLAHPDALPRFQGEVKAAAKLDHQNIVRAYDAEQVGSMHLLVMEYVEGTSLAELVAKKGPQPIAYACHYIRQAALGLQHAFEQGMVHRDIKPQNLMVNPRGQVKVLDFGLARMRSERKAGGGLTQADAFMGTPEYVSPEQATDARSADTRADIYSLGCTLFFLLTGRPPFQESTIVKLILAQIEKEPPALRDVRADVPAELSAVVARMLAKDPARRFQTPIEVNQALAVFVKAGTKRAAAGGSPAVPGVSSPARGTALAADTSQIKAILRDMPGKTPAKDAAASAFAGMGEGVVSAKKQAKPARKAATPVPAAWYRRGPVLAGIGAAVLALGLGAWLLAGVVFKTKVKTADGILIIEVSEPNPEVFVDGEKVMVSWRNGGKKAEIRVKPGSYKVEVKKDGYSVVGKELTFKDGDKEIFTARLLPERQAAKVDVPPPEKSPTPPDPRPVDAPPPTTPRSDYDAIATGRWVSILKAPGESVVSKGATFKDGVLQVKDGEAVDRAVRAKDLIMRAKVKKGSGRSLALVLRQNSTTSPDRSRYAAIYFHMDRVGAGRAEGNRWTNCFSGNYYALPAEAKGKDGEFFEFAAAIVGDKLTIYINGKLVSEEHESAVPLGPGAVGVVADWCQVEFKDIEVQSLDSVAKPVPTADTGFVPLFNGKDLTGWKPHPTDKAKWEVKDGILIGSGEKGHLFSERDDYENFHFRVECMLDDIKSTPDGFGDNGQYFRAEFSPERPKGYWANTPHLPLRTWFTEEVIAEGDRIIIKINGKVREDGHDNRYRKGHFALRQHGNFSVVKYRKIEIKELPTTKSEAPPAANVPAVEKGFVPLFNGKDLTGWKTHPKQRGNWRVEKGVLIGSGPAASHLYSNRGDYKNFHLRVEARINDGGNSGVYFRARFGPILPPNNPIFLQGYEAQINATHRDPKKTGSLIGIVTVAEAPHKPNEWFTEEVIAQGSHLVIKVNGNTTADYTDDKRLYTSGHLALQQLDAATVVEFRKIEIKELPRTKP